MRYIELVQSHPLVWALFGVYLVGTSWLAWLGHKKTDGIESFAVGKGDMHPVVVGVTLAASVASAATFVLNPGLVYVFGLSALLHLGVAAGSGVIVGLFAMSFGFRRVGQQIKAITLPQWMGQRYQSKGLAVFFAAVNLLSITFMVLIVAGLAIVMRLTLGLSNPEAVVLIIGFVFSYIFLGGTYAHAYTNTLQGIVMVVIATVIVASGLSYLADGFGPALSQLATIDPALATAYNPKSPLYGSTLSVWISGFVIGFALVCQPHILTKALYVKTDKAVLQYLLVATAVSVVFTSLLLVGLYAHLSDIPPEAFLDAATGKPKADAVVTVYIAHTFGPTLRAVIAVALLAAGMSTLDGILVAMSSIAANDLYLNLAGPWLKGKTPAERSVAAHRASQVILVALGVLTLIISLSPPPLISIFGQIGVFGIACASCVPILFGIFVPHLKGRVATLAAVSALSTYVLLYAWARVATSEGVNLVDVVQGWGPVAALFDTGMPQLGLLNPAVPATYGVLVSVLVALPSAVAGFVAPRATEPVER